MKKYALLTFSAIIIMLLISCSPVAPEEEEEPWDFWEPEDKELIIWSYKGQQWMDDYKEEFMLDNPDFTLTMGSMEGTDINRIALAIQTGTQPDAFYAHHWSSRFYFANVLQPFDQYIDNDVNYNRDDIHFSAYERGTMNGQLYTLTGHMTILLLVYNKDLLEMCGIDPDSVPHTWDDMIERQKAVVQFDTRGKCEQVAILNAAGGNFQYASTYDSVMYGPPDGVTISVDREAVIKMWEIVYELEDIFGKKAGLSALLSSSYGLNNQTGFRRGNVAYEMTYYGTPWWFEDVPNYGVCNFPQFGNNEKDNAAAVIHDLWYLTRESRNPDGAWYFIRWYLTSGMINVDEGNSYFRDPVNYFPQFFTHTYTRDRCYELYLDEISEGSKDAIKVRDEVADLVTAYDWGHAANDHGSFNGPIYDTLSERRAPPASFLKQIQKQQDNISAVWKAEKERQGWSFEDDNPWGTPPVDITN